DGHAGERPRPRSRLGAPVRAAHAAGCRVSVRKTLRAIAKDSKAAAAQRIAAGRSVEGGTLAPRKDGAAGSTAISLTPKGRLRVKSVGKPLGGSLARVALKGKTKTTASSYTTTYDG